MPVRLNVEVEMVPNPAIVAQAYFAKAEQVQELRVPMQEAAEIAAKEIEANFDAEGRPTAWQPLAEDTLLRRQTEGLSSKQKSNLSLLKSGKAFPESEVSVEQQQSQASTIISGLRSGIKILDRSGDLKTGATDPSSWQYYNMGAQVLVAELMDPTGYGHFHLEGAPGNNLPIRDFVYISPEGISEMESVLLEWVLE